jgi:TetR/AcrR family transcriptional regulator, transcriptional repressor for nem operon
MRKSRAEAAETRKRIVDAAAREFRRKGIHAGGLASVMAEAGLTPGGFYKHFDSKEQLITEASEAGISTVINAFEAIASRTGDEEAFKSIVESYVSVAHRDNSMGGCPLAGMGSELAHGGEETRAAATQGFNDLVDVLATSFSRSRPDGDRSEAVFALVAMIGAVTISRIITDPAASTLVLQQVKQHLKAI